MVARSRYWKIGLACIVSLTCLLPIVSGKIFEYQLQTQLTMLDQQVSSSLQKHFKVPLICHFQAENMNRGYFFTTVDLNLRCNGLEKPISLTLPFRIQHGPILWQQRWRVGWFAFQADQELTEQKKFLVSYFFNIEHTLSKKLLEISGYMRLLGDVSVRATLHPGMVKHQSGSAAWGKFDLKIRKNGQQFLTTFQLPILRLSNKTDVLEAKEIQFTTGPDATYLDMPEGSQLLVGKLYVEKQKDVLLLRDLRLASYDAQDKRSLYHRGTLSATDIRFNQHIFGSSKFDYHIDHKDIHIFDRLYYVFQRPSEDWLMAIKHMLHDDFRMHLDNFYLTTPVGAISLQGNFTLNAGQASQPLSELWMIITNGNERLSRAFGYVAKFDFELKVGKTFLHRFLDFYFQMHYLIKSNTQFEKASLSVMKKHVDRQKKRLLFILAQADILYEEHENYVAHLSYKRDEAKITLNNDVLVLDKVKAFLS